MVKHIRVTKEMQDKMAEEYNERQDLIDEIIDTQSSKNKVFVYVAKREELEKLSLDELYFILNVSKRVEEVK